MPDRGSVGARCLRARPAPGLCGALAVHSGTASRVIGKRITVAPQPPNYRNLTTGYLFSGMPPSNPDTVIPAPSIGS